MKLQISISATTFQVPPISELRAMTPAEKAALLKKANSHFDRAIAKAKKEITSLTSERIRVLAKLGAEAKPRTPKVPRSPTTPNVTAAPAAPASASPVSGRDLPAAYDSSMKGLKWHDSVNAGRSFPENAAGFWRKSLKERSVLPFPIAYTPRGYNKREFIAALLEVQKRATSTLTKGYSPHRWTGKPNGIIEYSVRQWRWPEGYLTYLRAGVPPSRKFYKFITGKDLASLPDM